MTTNFKIAESLSSTITLHDGTAMPMFGLGSSKSPNVEQVVVHALRMGYRLIDTAAFYGNEEIIGRALKTSGVPRDEIFLVTKLWLDDHSVENVGKSIHASLRRLDTSYIDLFLIHHPGGRKIVETYSELLKYKKQGVVRSVGVANFEIQHLEGLKNAGCPTPAVNQIELHPWQPREALVNYCRENNIAVMGYSPLAKAKRLDNHYVTQLATKYNKSSAQCLLRWSIQRGVITIPKTSTLKRVQENADVFDFSLSEEDLKTLDGFEEWSCMPHPGWQPNALRMILWEDIA